MSDSEILTFDPQARTLEGKRGVVLGVAQTLGAQISPSFQILAGHLVYFAVLAFRPRGLFPRMD